MSVISMEMALSIASAHSEIAGSEKMLRDIRKANERQNDPDICDPFGMRHRIQLGVPRGDSGLQFLNISWDLAEPLIEAHIAQMKAKLTALSAAAVSELAATTQDPSNQGETSVPPLPATAR